MHSHPANICIKIVQLFGDTTTGDCNVLLQWEHHCEQIPALAGGQELGAPENGDSRTSSMGRGTALKSPEQRQQEKKSSSWKSKRAVLGEGCKEEHEFALSCSGGYNSWSSWESFSENPGEHFLSNNEYYPKKASFPLFACLTSGTQTFLFVRLICFLYFGVEMRFSLRFK